MDVMGTESVKVIGKEMQMERGMQMAGTPHARRQEVKGKVMVRQRPWVTGMGRQKQMGRGTGMG